jgi:hypothetical protein
MRAPSAQRMRDAEHLRHAHERREAEHDAAQLEDLLVGARPIPFQRRQQPHPEHERAGERVEHEEDPGPPPRVQSQVDEQHADRERQRAGGDQVPAVRVRRERREQRRRARSQVVILRHGGQPSERPGRRSRTIAA